MKRLTLIHLLLTYVWFSCLAQMSACLKQEATVYTHEPALKRKLTEMKKVCPDVILEREDNGSVEYTIPKKLVAVRKPPKKRDLSSEEKQAIADRLSQSRKEE